MTKKNNTYRIISYIMNFLFWCNLIGVALVAAFSIFLSVDSSILKGGNEVQASLGVLNFNLKGYESNLNLGLVEVIILGIGGGFSTIMFWNFKILFSNAANDILFVESNTKAVFTIGIVLLISSLVSDIPKVYLANQLAPFIHLTKGNLEISYSMNSPLFVAAIFIILLGFFFKKAVKIVRENELTI